MFCCLQAAPPPRPAGQSVGQNSPGRPPCHAFIRAHHLGHIDLIGGRSPHNKRRPRRKSSGANWPGRKLVSSRRRRRANLIARPQRPRRPRGATSSFDATGQLDLTHNSAGWPAGESGHDKVATSKPLEKIQLDSGGFARSQGERRDWRARSNSHEPASLSYKILFICGTQVARLYHLQRPPPVGPVGQLRAPTFLRGGGARKVLARSGAFRTSACRRRLGGANKQVSAPPACSQIGRAHSSDIPAKSSMAPKGARANFRAG